MSKCVSNQGEFSGHDYHGDDERTIECVRCGHQPYMYGAVSSGDFESMRMQVAEMHGAMLEIKTSLLPMVEKMQTGGIMGVLTGMRGR